MPDSARVLTMISPLDAERPPTKASSARVSLCAAMPRPKVKYSGLVLTPSLSPAQRISGTARLISSR